MNEYEATIQINPTDDIKFILEESGCYESEIEMMKAGGTYDAFVKRVYDAIWQCVCDHRRFCESAQGNSFRAVFH